MKTSESTLSEETILMLRGMRMWTAGKGLSAGTVTIECKDKPCPLSGAPNAIIAAIKHDDAADSTTTRTSSIVTKRPESGEPQVADDLDAKNPKKKIKRDLYILPGFVDSHVHFFDGGRRKTALNLSNCYSRGDVVKAIRVYIRKSLLGCRDADEHTSPFTEEEVRQLNRWKESKGVDTNTADETTRVGASIPWIAGFQWNDKQLGGVPNKLWLDEACKGQRQVSSNNGATNSEPLIADIPIVLVRLDCHSCVVNSTALRLCGIDHFGPPNPVGGVIDRWTGSHAPTGAATPKITLTDAAVTDMHVSPSDGEGDSTPFAVQKAVTSLGEPTGYLREKAMLIVNTARRKSWVISDDDLIVSYNAASEELLKNGVTSCFSMTSLDYDNLKEFEFLMKLTNKAEAATATTTTTTRKYATPAVRMRSVVKFEEIDQLKAFKNHYFDQSSSAASSSPSSLCDFGTEYFKFGAVKIFSDGSLGSRTAAMVEPYGDIEATEPADSVEGDGDGGGGTAGACPCGTLLSSCEDLHASIKTVAESSLQCCTHAIGDRACMVIQDAYESCRKGEIEYAGAKLRFRIEHCQHIASLSEIDRYKRTGTIPSVQPCHLLFDGDHIDSGRLGPKRINLAYAFRSMLDRGVKPVFGTDWMVAPLCPISNILAAVHRRPIQFTSSAQTQSDSSGKDDDNLTNVPVWNEREKLTVEESLTAYTADAAHGMFMENVIGKIELGFFADFVILDANPLGTLSDDESIGGGRPLKGCTPTGAQRPRNQARVVATIVGGRVRYLSPDYRELLEMAN